MCSFSIHGFKFSINLLAETFSSTLTTRAFTITELHLLPLFSWQMKSTWYWRILWIPFFRMRPLEQLWQLVYMAVGVLNRRAENENYVNLHVNSTLQNFVFCPILFLHLFQHYIALLLMDGFWPAWTETLLAWWLSLCPQKKQCSVSASLVRPRVMLGICTNGSRRKEEETLFT